MPAWLDYQKLAASIYTALEENALVTHDDKIFGVKSKTARQIDVSLRLSVAGHNILVIVQAKDLSRPADVNVVGEFLAVIEDVQAAKGVLICSSGFTEGAVNYAAQAGIDLCTVHDATNPKWALEWRMPLLWIQHVIDIDYEFDLRPDHTNDSEVAIDLDPRNWPVTFDGGQSFAPLGPFLQAKMLESELSYEVGPVQEITFPLGDAAVLLGGSYLCPAASVLIKYSVKKVAWHGTFRLSNVIGLLNKSTSTLKARVRLTDKDVPMERDPSWPPLDDIEGFISAHPNLLTLECAAPKFAEFGAHDIQMKSFRASAQESVGPQ